MKDIRRIPVCEEVVLTSPELTVVPGDMIELCRDKSEEFLTATILTRDGTKIPISLETAEMMFRNGALGKTPWHMTRTQKSLLTGFFVTLLVPLVCFVGSRPGWGPTDWQNTFSWRDVVAGAVFGIASFLIMQIGARSEASESSEPTG
jgi:hypothetical protein